MAVRVISYYSSTLPTLPDAKPVVSSLSMFTRLFSGKVYVSSKLAGQSGVAENCWVLKNGVWSRATISEV